MSDATQNEIPDFQTLSVESAVEWFIEHATNLKASDLFFHSNEDHTRINIRTLGVIRPVVQVPLQIGRRYLAHIKAMADLDISERRRPQDGRWIHETAEGERVDLRINTIPTLHGEDFAIRILARAWNLYALSEIGMIDSQETQLQEMLLSPSGMILICGPTGSGKTATQYACLLTINTGDKKINTIEDPVEYSIEGVRQSQINPMIGLGFSDLLRSVMRQSPDVIMVGEIRDKETADTAVRAANSGHLVFATLHAPVAAGSVQTMRSFGVNPHFLSTSLLGVVSQRLVRTLCPECKTAFELGEDSHTFDEIKPWLEPGYDGDVLYAPKGCSACGMQGYDGRSGVFEVMTIDKTIRNMISEGRPTREIRDAAVANGMLQLRHSALLKVAHGITSTEEVFRVIPSEYLLLDD